MLEEQVVVVGANGKTRQLQHAIARCLSFSCESQNCRNRDQTIADILVGSKKIRIGAAPCSEHYQHLVERVERFTSRNLPIEILCLWGAVKGYGLDPSRLLPDIADLLAIRRFVALNAQVQQVYSPGLRVRLIRENIGEHVLSTCPENVTHNAAIYGKSLDAIALALNPTLHVAFENESDIMGNMGLTPRQFIKQGIANGQVIHNYWQASHDLPDEQKGQVPEYTEAQAIGWNGVIPNCIRQWYLDRVSAEHANEDEAQRGKQVCVYFGFALARYQVGLYRGSFSDGQSIIPPLKASFVPYPPGTEEVMRKGRLEYKVRDSKGHNTTPSWCGFGFMRQDCQGQFEPIIHGVRDYKTLPFEPILTRIAAPKGEAVFRADIALA
jgi:hypothetical protein